MYNNNKLNLCSLCFAFMCIVGAHIILKSKCNQNKLLRASKIKCHTIVLFLWKYVAKDDVLTLKAQQQKFGNSILSVQGRAENMSWITSFWLILVKKMNDISGKIIKMYDIAHFNICMPWSNTSSVPMKNNTVTVKILIQIQYWNISSVPVVFLLFYFCRLN